MIWHVSIKLRTSKGFKGFFKNVVEWVFAFQLFMWYFLVFFHGVFISISKWGQLNQNITSHSVQLQGCWKRLSRRYKKRTSLLRFWFVLFWVWFYSSGSFTGVSTLLTSLHVVSLFVAKTSVPAKCRKIKDTSVSYWLNRHL